MLSALNRMILWELVRVFALALVAVTGIFLIGGVIQEASRLGLSPANLARVVPLLVPSFLPYTIPATVLFASCVAYGRLANDNEVVAVKAAGIDLYRTLVPALLLGLGGAAAAAGVSYAVIPRTQVLLRAEIAKDPEEFLYSQLKRDRYVRSPAAAKSSYALFVRDVQGRRLVDVVIKKLDPSRLEAIPGVGARPRYGYVARAPEAQLRVDLANRVLYVDAENLVGGSEGSNTMTTGNRPFQIDLGDILTAADNRASPMLLDWDALPGRAAELRAGVAQITANRAAGAAAAAAEREPARLKTLADQDLVFGLQLKEAWRNVRNVEYEFHARPALAASSVAFALIGAAVGMWFSRSDYLSSFVVCWIPTILVYFVPFFAGGSLAKDGKLPMPAGVWLADAVVTLLALGLVRRLVRR